MAKWYSIPTSLRMTDGEYRANVSGMNMVFGAVLGFILAGAADIPTTDFIILLLFSIGIVVSIFYLESSPYRLFYALLTAGAIAALPFALADIFAANPLPKLQPTFAVWAATVFFIELVPRERKAADAPATGEEPSA